MALSKKDAPANDGGEQRSDVGAKDLGVPTPRAMRSLAEDLPEKDKVQKEVKAAMLADSMQEEVKHKVEVVKASPDAEETPSGYALMKVAGISDDTKRGEEYTKHKTARRHGYVPADES